MSRFDAESTETGPDVNPGSCQLSISMCACSKSLNSAKKKNISVRRLDFLHLLLFKQLLATTISKIFWQCSANPLLKLLL